MSALKSWWQDRRPSAAQIEASRRRDAAREEWYARIAADEGDRIERAGALAATLAGRRSAYLEDGISMDPKIRKAIAERVTRITSKRSEDAGNLLGELKALAADDGRDPAWKDRERARIRAAVEEVNAAARNELAEVMEPLVKSARARLAAGTPLESSALAEAQLLVTEYGGRTKLERRHVAIEAAEALAAGAVDRARTLHRAAVALGVGSSDTGQELDAADPVKAGAQGDLGTMSELLDTHEAAIAAELAAAGVGGISAQVQAKAAAYVAGMAEAPTT